MDNQNDRDIYVIPPNFVDTGTFFGGMFKARNVIEAGILAGGTGIPIFLFLPTGLTVRIIVLCLTSLPLGLIGLIGISGESLTSFLTIFLKYLRNRRVVGGTGEAVQEESGNDRRENTQRTEERIFGGRKKTAEDNSKGAAYGEGNKSVVKGKLREQHQETSAERKEAGTGKRMGSGKSCKGRKGSLGGISGWRRTGEADFPEEFDQVKGHEIRQKLRPGQNRKDREESGKSGKGLSEGTPSKGGLPESDFQRSRGAGAGQRGAGARKVETERQGRGSQRGCGQKPGQRKYGRQDKIESGRRKGQGHSEGNCIRKQNQPVAGYLPIDRVANGIIYTKDHRYIKVVEVVPINFLLRSAREQRGIIYSFVSYLKISPVKLQFKVLTRRADIGRHINTVRKEMGQETNEQCRLMQEDYLQFVQQISSREAVTRRFFLIFEYEPWDARRGDEEAEAISQLQGAVRTASNYLRQCGNEVIIPDNEDEFTVDVLYNLLCRNESAEKPLSRKVQEVAAGCRSHADAGFGNGDAGGSSYYESSISDVEFFAPKSIDFTHSHYICIDGLYYAYLMVPSDGYKSQVPAGWLSLMVNAGDGIDLDMFLFRQSKEQIIQKVGQQLRINRSKIKDASDTNTDFDDIDSAIRSGYFLKEGLVNNEDFYYMSLLITITAFTVDDLEWKVNEMKKLLLSQDMRASSCHFREEQAFLSTLPLVSMEKKLYGRTKRNLLTGGAAGCYPFTSYEMCDDNGILLGVNKYNSSLIIVDIFNSAVYKNANMAILGTSGAGKTFTMQLMALRMRRKGIPIFIIAPLKGHEFHRAEYVLGPAPTWEESSSRFPRQVPIAST